MKKVFALLGLEVRQPRILPITKNFDFGPGFYVLDDEKAARSLDNKGYRKCFGRPVLNVYDFDDEGAKACCNILSFEKMDCKCRDFMLANRANTYSGISYDIVIGPAMNDDACVALILLETSQIGRRDFQERVRDMHFNRRIAFASEKALSFLHFVKVKKV